MTVEPLHISLIFNFSKMAGTIIGRGYNKKGWYIDIQGSPHIATPFCRRFAALTCKVQKNSINIFLRLIYWLSAYEKSALWLTECRNATMQCKTRPDRDLDLELELEKQKSRS